MSATGPGRKPKPKRDRIDRLLVERDLAPSRTRAQALVMAGKVRVQGRRVDKPGTTVAVDAPIEVVAPDHPYVSRGGVKLAGALDHFATLRIASKTAMDVGASTGGFTDCLLQRGATKVHAVDVGYGQLAWKLAQDPRVHVLDRRNIRHLRVEEVGASVELVVVDCSFIALAKVLPHLARFLQPRADVVALVKPQFELDPGRVGKGGIVRDPADRQEALQRVRAVATSLGYSLVDQVQSSIAGREGNVEYLVWLRWQGDGPIQPPDGSGSAMEDR